MAKKSNAQCTVLLGTPAVRQILSRLNKSEKEENALAEKVWLPYLYKILNIELTLSKLFVIAFKCHVMLYPTFFQIYKIEASCTKFDHRGKGCLTVDEIFNVVKLQNGVDISKDEVNVTIIPC